MKTHLGGARQPGRSCDAGAFESVQSWTRLHDAEQHSFRFGTARFVDMCQVASLRRFPAGQFDWVRGGLPLSYVFGVSYWNLPKALYVTLARLRGRSPVFFTHLGYHRPSASLSELEANRSYYRMARSMELQPDIKGPSPPPGSARRTLIA